MNIYEVLKDMDLVHDYRILPKKFTDDKRKKLTTKNDEKLFYLLKSISSLVLKMSEKDAEFLSYIQIDDICTFSIEDLTEEDYKLLKSLDLLKLPLIIKSRICDIIWSQKREFSFAKNAAEAYFELFNLCFQENDYLEGVNRIRRAIQISIQINDNEMCDKCCQALYDHVIRVDGKDPGVLSLQLIEIILKQKYGDFNIVLGIINNIILLSKNNPNKTEKAYLLKIQILNSMKKITEATQTYLELAEYFWKFGEDVIAKNKLDAFKVQYYFEKSIRLYRNNGEAKIAERVHKRLIAIQKYFPRTMKSYKTAFDGDKIKELINHYMEGLSFEECIIRIAQIVPFYKKEEFKRKLMEEITQSPISRMFTKKILNSSGQTIFTLPPLNISNPEKDPVVLDMHICNSMYEHQTLLGNVFLRFAMTYIKENFVLHNKSFDFIIDDNILIPQDRQEIFRLALYMAFNGDSYAALHILAPQIENLFRCIAKEAGALTITLENDGSSREKVLSSIFDLPELVDCYDNDILFLFEGLLNNLAGANIRNNIAHGLMNSKQGNAGANLFFICAVVKLLISSSKSCIEIISKSSKLQADISDISKFHR